MKTDCTALPKGWQREEVLRKTGLSAGKIDVYYYSPSGKKIETKPQLARQLGDIVDIATFDFESGKIIANDAQSFLSLNHRSLLKRKLLPSNISGTIGTHSFSTPGLSPNNPSALRRQLEFSRGMRTDISLVPPIRQTASIFKQPVTVVKNQEGGKVKHDSKHGQEKPKQLFWEKRLEGLRACNVAGEEFENIELPKSIKAVGPNIFQQTVLQSIATSLHVSNQPVTGQTANLQTLLSNSGAYLNPDQPLMQSLNVTDEDIRRQEDRVGTARRRLQEALKG